ncbi:MAG TPA: Ig-like domain-containing protein, partial [Methylomirabilota bacterium]|nr:Ig-like domain-containing protein [Methylomirabilota bacterium]
MKKTGSLVGLFGALMGVGCFASWQVFGSAADENPPPRVEIVRPPAGQMFPASADIEIAVVARDPNGWVSRVEFFANGESIGVEELVFIQPPPPGELQHFSMVWSNVPPGRYELSVTATDDAGATTRSGVVGVSVLEPCRLPVVTLTVEDSAAWECDPRILAPHGACQARFRVTRSCATNRELTVLYSLAGTASNGVDYPEMPGKIVIPAGAFSADIWIDPTDDAEVEGTETVQLCLLPPDCLASDPVPLDCYLIGRQSCAVAFIQDNDAPPNHPPAVALIHPPDGSVLPAGEPLRLVATATDVDGYVQTVEFFAGTNSLGVVPGHPWIIDPVPLPEPLAVSAALDTSILPIPVPRGFTLIWSNPPPGEHKLSAVATDNVGASTQSEKVGILVIEQPRPQVVSVLARDPEGGEGPLDETLAAQPDPAVFAVVRQGPTNDALTVYYRLEGT